MEAERTGAAPGAGRLRRGVRARDSRQPGRRLRPPRPGPATRTGAHGPAEPPVGSSGPPGQRWRTMIWSPGWWSASDFIVLLIIAYAIGSKALVVLAAAVVVAAAAEAYGMLQRSGFRPATLLGLVGGRRAWCSAPTGRGSKPSRWPSCWSSPGRMTWYLLRIVEARPLANVAVTTMAFVWVALFGSYSAIMLRAAHGKGLLLGAVLVAVAADIGGFRGRAVDRVAAHGPEHQSQQDRGGLRRWPDRRGDRGRHRRQGGHAVGRACGTGWSWA